MRVNKNNVLKMAILPMPQLADISPMTTHKGVESGVVSGKGSVRKRPRSKLMKKKELVQYLASGGDREDTTRVNRFMLYGFGKGEMAVAACKAIKNSFGFRHYAGFTREECWEGYFYINRNTNVLPCILDIQRFIERHFKGVSIERLEDTINKRVLTCIFRIRECNIKFGDYPLHLSTRIVEHTYEERLKEDNAQVEMYTGMPVTAGSMMNLYCRMTDLENANTSLVTAVQTYKMQITLLTDALHNAERVFAQKFQQQPAPSGEQALEEQALEEQTLEEQTPHQMHQNT